MAEGSSLDTSTPRAAGSVVFATFGLISPLVGVDDQPQARAGGRSG